VTSRSCKSWPGARPFGASYHRAGEKITACLRYSQTRFLMADAFVTELNHCCSRRWNSLNYHATLPGVS
jgi:hypothetical protein